MNEICINCIFEKLSTNFPPKMTNEKEPDIKRNYASTKFVVFFIPVIKNRDIQVHKHNWSSAAAVISILRKFQRTDLQCLHFQWLSKITYMVTKGFNFCQCTSRKNTMPGTGAAAGRVGSGSSTELGLSRNGKLAFILKNHVTCSCSCL